MNDNRSLFPLKHAKGKAFCNRVKETVYLFDEVMSGQHVLVVSPRRYGKSSLVLHAAEKHSLLIERVDLFVAIDQGSIESLILKGCQNLINQILSPTDKAMKLIRNYLKSIKLKWLVGTNGINIEVIPEKGVDAISSILEMLKLIENILSNLEKKAVLFIDEFQEVGKLSKGRGLEGAIRHVAEQTEQLVFIFSGSSRHLLTQMFDDRNRPLYNLCERVNLDRISAEDYQAFINKIAVRTWGKGIDTKTLSSIFYLTERHPYYMNVLCRRVWGEGLDEIPSNVKVESLWSDYVEQETSRISADLSLLGNAQLKILTVISNGVSKELTSKHILHVLNLSSSSVVKAKKMLVQKDYIEHKNGEYKVIDPLIKYMLKNYYSDYLRDFLHLSRKTHD